jgi:hypothetical protein
MSTSNQSLRDHRSIPLSIQGIKDLKGRLSVLFSNATSSHISESIACGLGFGTHAGLLDYLKGRKPNQLVETREFDGIEFLERLNRLTGKEFSPSLFGKTTHTPQPKPTTQKLEDEFFELHAALHTESYPDVLVNTIAASFLVGEDGYLWAARAKTLMQAVLSTLWCLNKTDSLPLETKQIRQMLSFSRLIYLADDDNLLPEDIRKLLYDYLSSLPKFDWDKGAKGIPQSQITLDQHGYLELMCLQALEQMEKADELNGGGYLFPVKMKNTFSS